MRCQAGSADLTGWRSETCSCRRRLRASRAFDPASPAPGCGIAAAGGIAHTRFRPAQEGNRAISTTAETAAPGGGVALGYPARSLWPDYTRAGIGLAIALLPMPWVPPGSFGNWLLGLLALLFGGFAAMTWVKQRSTIRMNPDGIRIHGPFGKAIAWNALDRLALRFYSTRKERGHGWMQLKLPAPGPRSPSIPIWTGSTWWRRGRRGRRRKTRSRSTRRRSPTLRR